MSTLQNIVTAEVASRPTVGRVVAETPRYNGFLVTIQSVHSPTVPRNELDGFMKSKVDDKGARLTVPPAPKAPSLELNTSDKRPNKSTHATPFLVITTAQHQALCP